MSINTLSIKKLLTKILAQLTVQETTLTTTYCTAYVKKQGSIVALNIIGKVASISTGTWIVLCTLPEGYRPKTQIDFVAYDNSTNTHNLAEATIRIETNGQVRLWPYETGNKQIHGTVTFITS